MSKNRAERRHQEERIKEKRKSKIEQYKEPTDVVREPTPKQIGRSAHTATNCSCWMCGNPRKYFGELSLQEKSFMELENLK